MGIPVDFRVKPFSGIKICFCLIFVLVSPPKINPLLKNQSVPLNATFAIKCYVEGDLPPKVNWSKNGLDLGMKENTLTIHNIAFKDAGWYGCTAKYWEGNIQANFWLDVTGK